MNLPLRPIGLGALLLLAANCYPNVWAQYDPGSRDPEAGSNPDSENKAAAKLKAAIGQKAPDFSFQANDGKNYRVSDFSGKWLLLQFGGSWCTSSESTAQYFSLIKKSLEGKPFEFVEIYDDASLDDALLYSLTDFHGIRGFVGLNRTPDFYEVGFIPVWYLIDPKGIIRLDGDYTDPQELQEKIAGILKTDPRFNGISLAPSPQDQRFLIASELMQARKWNEAATVLEEVLKDDPANPHAIARHARCIAWTKGYKNASKDLDEKIKALSQSTPDFLKLFQATYLLKGDGRGAEGAKIAESLQTAHPESKFLTAALLALSKTPDELSNQEFRNLKDAVRFYGEVDLNSFYGYALEHNGQAEQAFAKFAPKGKVAGIDAYPAAGLLHRIGADDQARQMLLGKNPPAPETADKRQAWELAMSAALIENWELSAAYGQRYEQHQPKRGEGLLFQLLAAMREGQPDKAKELRSRLEQVLAANYKSAPLIQGDGPTRDQLMAIGDENARMVTALSAYLFAKMDEQNDKAAKARRNSLNAYEASRLYYALIYSITTPPSEGDFKAKAEVAEKNQQRKVVKETLDAEDAKLAKALGISTNNPAESEKVGAYFLGKLSPVYEKLQTNEFFPEMEKYHKELEATFVLTAGLKQLDQLPAYCAKNNILQGDLTAFLNGCVVNDLAYASTPVSEEVRKQYIELTELCIKNGSRAFFSGTYKNWDALGAFLNKRNAFLIEAQEKKTSQPSPTTSSSPSPLPSVTPAPVASPTSAP